MAKENNNKSFVLRIDAATMDALELWAADEFRSINGQLQWIIADALRRSGTDFDRSRTYGTGLQRTKTIARGDGICNFRFKKDRPVVQNWSTELALIRASRA